MNRSNSRSIRIQSLHDFMMRHMATLSFMQMEINLPNIVVLDCNAEDQVDLVFFELLGRCEVLELTSIMSFFCGLKKLYEKNN